MAVGRVADDDGAPYAPGGAIYAACCGRQRLAVLSAAPVVPPMPYGDPQTLDYRPGAADLAQSHKPPQGIPDHRLRIVAGTCQAG